MDDGVIHCVSKQQAEMLWDAIGQRMVDVGLRLHPDKTRVAYCKDSNRRDKFDNVSFTFLGNTFRPRRARNKRKGVNFTSFQPAMSREKLAAKGREVRRWRLHRRPNDHRGQLRERRAENACPDRCCVHARCWREQAHVSELTGLLREGPGEDQLASWPPSMRVFARRERPHPCAQLSLFEAEDGWRYSLWVTNLPTSLRGWRANPAYIDAAHRVHARVEDGIRTGKDCGIGHFPSHDFAINSAWLAAALIAATLLAWLRLLALDGDLARAEPKPRATRSCTPAPG